MLSSTFPDKELIANITAKMLQNYLAGVETQ